MPGGQRHLQEPLGRLRIGGDQPVDPLIGRHDRVEGRQPVAGGFVEQIDAVEVQDVEEEHRQRLLRPRGRPPEPRRGDLEPVRAPVGAQRDRFAVGDQVFHRERERRLHDLGQPCGDVVEAAGVDRHVVAGAVDLYPGPVQLGLENALAAESFECIGDSGGGLGQHRSDGLPDPQGELRQRCLSAGQRGCGDGGQVAAQHRGAADGRGRYAGGLGDGVGHHPGESALPQFAAEQTAQERLLGLRCRGEQFGESPPGGPGALARDRADFGERRVDARHRQRRVCAPGGGS